MGMGKRSACATAAAFAVLLVLGPSGCGQLLGESGSSDEGCNAPSAVERADATADASDGGAAPDATACVDAGEAGSECYFTLAGVTHAQAKAACEQAGAHLVTITSQAEQDLVASLAGDGRCWIGLVAQAPTNDDRSKFQWSNGEPMTFEAWEPDNPNNGEPCVTQDRTDGWSDWACDESVCAICER